jgi:hypothetical protein
MVKRAWMVALAGITVVVLVPAGAHAATQARVNVGSPASPFPVNKQNEPTVAIDPSNPSVLAAGSNDEIDVAPCDGADCPFTPGVGTSGLYFSFDGGTSWLQPTYDGYSARDGSPGPGPIGTVPNYYEAGLVSDGDAVTYFGPRPDADGNFDWANGSRLYYANLTANFSTDRQENAFRGFEAIAVSHADDLAAAANGQESAWSAPSIVTQESQSQTTFSDKEAIAADDAESSPYFGNVYVCYSKFKGQEIVSGFPMSIHVTRSTDGGETWAKPQHLTHSVQNNVIPGRQGCAVRTDSNGVVYVVWEDTADKRAVMDMSRSYDGGRTWEQPQVVAQITDVGKFDDVRSISFDGVAGARTSSFPSLDVANGAPTGAGAPNTIELGWSDGSDGLNHEHALVQLSTNGGDTWGTPKKMERVVDRPDFAFFALSPDGTDLYVVYNGFIDPFRDTTSTPRRMRGVVRHADVVGRGLTNRSTVYLGPLGDARASSANSLIDEFIGDYNTVDATNDGYASVFNDVSSAAICPAMNAYRQSVVDGSPIDAPAPPTDCPATFGNTEILSAVGLDPTP